MSDILNRHPCFGAKRGVYGRIHLPVAPQCNISCRYCDKKCSCANESYPGLTTQILHPEEVVDYIKRHDTVENNLQVIGIAGPGEPLYNNNTFLSLERLKEVFPEKILCFSTNGFLLPQSLERLIQLGVDCITVTLNTLRLETAKQIYRGIDNLQEFLSCQQQGVIQSVQAGVLVKINTVLIPDVNQNEIRELAQFAQKAGATIMNIMPLIPLGDFKGRRAPTAEELENARVLAGCFVRQHRGCTQCRADAVGIPRCGSKCHLG